MRRLPRGATAPRSFALTLFIEEDSRNMRTYLQKTAETSHDWYVVDAAGQRLGTLAVRIARVLSGKQKPTWTPHIDNGDHVIVINADKVELGGNKLDQKIYYRHCGFPGGSARADRARSPTTNIPNA